MSSLPTLEAEQIARGAERRALAASELAKTQRIASPFIVLINVLCGAGALAFLAISTSVDTRGFVGAIAGGALLLGAMAYGELRRLQRRVAALEIFVRDGGV